MAFSDSVWTEEDDRLAAIKPEPRSSLEVLDAYLRGLHEGLRLAREIADGE